MSGVDQLYEYQAIGSSGKVKGRTRAASELALDRALEAQGLTLTTARPVSDRRVASVARLAQGDLVAFTNQIATVVSAGVPLVQGIQSMSGRMRDPRSRAILEDLVRELEAGGSLSDAMALHKRSFPDVYRASVEAGELSGSMPRVLKRMSSYLEWIRSIRQTTVQALVYPAMLVCAIIVLVAVLVGFVVPQIVKMFPGGPEDLPAMTRRLLVASEFMTSNVVGILASLGLAVVAFVLAIKTPSGRLVLHTALMWVPRLGTVARMLALSKFASTAGTLQRAGCDIYQVLSLSARSCGNAVMEAAFARIIDRVRQGQSLTDAFEKESVIDPLMVQMVAVGEQSGDLGKSLEDLTDYYNGEVPRLVKWLMSLMEPAILVIAALVVGYVLLAAILPVLDLYEKM